MWEKICKFFHKIIQFLLDYMQEKVYSIDKVKANGNARKEQNNEKNKRRIFQPVSRSKMELHWHIRRMQSAGTANVQRLV